MAPKHLSHLTLCLIFTLQTACATHKIIRDEEYRLAENHFSEGEPEKALKTFPGKEKEGFVTTVEKSWVGYWDGATQNEKLMAQAKTLDDRKYVSVSREAEFFFYNESADGYIPAEHEVIVLHMLNAMYFMRNQNWASAEVEARKATFFLQNYFRVDQPHFDDPALRIWLAGIWAALGYWSEAQVDLRKAHELSPNIALKILSERPEAPENFSVVFTGTGPEVHWKEGVYNPEFVIKTTRPNYSISYDSLPWYLRHEKRNSQIRDVVTTSNYMAQYYGLQTSVSAEKTVGFVAANTLRTIAVVTATVIIGVGVLLIAALASKGAQVDPDALGYIFGGGIAAGTSIYGEGNKVSNNFAESTKKNKEKGLQDLRTYRFVRFLPSWISVTDQLTTKSYKAKSVNLKSPTSKTNVEFIQDF